MARMKLCESSNSSLESFDNEVNYRALALEASNDLNTMLNNSLRSLDVIEGLIHMRRAFVSKESFNNSDLELIKANVQMALAGTGVPATVAKGHTKKMLYICESAIEKLK